MDLLSLVGNGQTHLSTPEATIRKDPFLLVRARSRLGQVLTRVNRGRESRSGVLVGHDAGRVEEGSSSVQHKLIVTSSSR